MTTYFVASGGSNTSPYDTWAKATTSLQTALTIASADGDVVVIQYNAVPSGDAEVAADVTYTVAADVFVVSASNDGGSAYTPTVMGTANWIGNSTTNRSILIVGADTSSHWYGVTFRNAGSTADSFSLAGANQVTRWESCYFWLGNTSTSARINLTTNNANGVARFIDCTFRFGNTSQAFCTAGAATIIGGSISSSGSTPSILFKPPAATTSPSVSCSGFDISLVTNGLVDDMDVPMSFKFERCKFGSGVIVLASQTTNPTLASVDVWVSDCSSGDTHGLMGFYNALGSVVSDTGIYYTSGAAAQSWKIVTSANCNKSTPFRTPFVDMYYATLTSMTPYFEVLRDGSATAYKDHEVWAEFYIKDGSGSTLASAYTDRCTMANYVSAGGSNQASGAGTGSWTGEGGTAWSGKCDSGNAGTPVEVGSLRGRIVFSATSATVYVDPQIRT